MSINGLLMRDLSRMANSADSRLAGRGTTDSEVIAEFERRERFGMSTADAAERKNRWDAEKARAATLAGYDEGDPPVWIRVNTKGMPPARAALARFIAWRDSVAAELAALVAMRDRLQATVNAPAAVEAKRSGLLRDQAKRLLEFVGLGEREAETGGFDVVERRALDTELDSAQHRADVAAIAIADIAQKISEKEVQLARLIERERSFVHSALREHADDLGREYLRRIEALRDTVTQLSGLRQFVGYGAIDKVELPEFRVASLEDSEKARTIVAKPGADKPWRELAENWGMTKVKSWMDD
jgi:hypothetical protein